MPSLLAGLFLFGLKQFCDRIVVMNFHRDWSPRLYWVPVAIPIESLNGADHNFVLALGSVAVPFALIGVWLTARRLKALGWPLLLAVLFFVPAVNLMFFVFLAVADRPAVGLEPRPTGTRLRWWPQADSVSLALSSTLSALAGSLSFGMAILVSPSYEWGMFFGVPLAIGLIATLLHSVGRVRSF